ncbi:MAG TPA: Smr/MutS family protein [Sphingomicrobium sp.]|nr:Smr/MutS family protein [Sphingomicrobium sp.]
MTATIRPLSREPTAKSEPAANAASEPPAAVTAAKREGPAQRRPFAPPPAPSRPGTTLDGTWDRKLSSGRIQPDRVVDLHGMNLDRAWRAIDVGLEQASAAGERVLLLITGHHRPGEPPVERGRIRAAVHDWLAASRHASKIAAVRGAHGRHGGGGSLYIILRRRG